MSLSTFASLIKQNMRIIQINPLLRTKKITINSPYFSVILNYSVKQLSKIGYVDGTAFPQ